MITYFPAIYPDELVYSLLSRFYLQSGYLSYTYAAEDIYAYKQVRPDHEFINVLHPEMREMIAKTVPMEKLVEKHTMYPYYGRFMGKFRRRKAFESLVTLNGNYKNLLAMPTKRDGADRFLRYCPLCAKADREQYGETYWHRGHQMVGVNVCPIHKCYLVNSSILISGKATPNLTAAEKVVPEGEAISRCNNLLELRLAEYTLAVFQAPVDIDSNVSAGRFLHSKLKGTKYISDSGLFRNLTVFYEDYLHFYEGLKEKTKMELWQVQKIFNNYRYNSYEICELAMFLNIPTQELVRMALPEETQHMDTLYRRVSKELDADFDIVKNIGDAVLKIYQTEHRVQQKCGAKGYQWSKRDTELLPEVKRTIKELYGNGADRPHKITPSLISRKLELPDKQLEKLPLCKAEILKYEESQQHYWAREVVWAVYKVLREGQSLNWRQVRNLTNMRRVNFEACLPYIDEMVEEEMAERIKHLL
ncbi:TniQ family protein [Ruminiclostridium cellobioparum]|uniref:TniQ family protein n=1 Tax=Ruminiclostridium cellobioparum TaxID=29355 RepID=UPI0004872344|nr:TniQ family protein [Ruminiclostridium cellobioparum]